MEITEGNTFKLTVLNKKLCISMALWQNPAKCGEPQLE